MRRKGHAKQRKKGTVACPLLAVFTEEEAWRAIRALLEAQPGAAEAFESLVKRGADRWYLAVQLYYGLQALSRDRSAARWRLMRVQRALEHAASELEHLDGELDSSIQWFEDLRGEARRSRALGSQAARLADHLDRRRSSHDYAPSVNAVLHHVRHATGRANYSAVADVLSAVIERGPNSVFTTRGLKQWRARHRWPPPTRSMVRGTRETIASERDRCARLGIGFEFTGPTPSN